MENPSKIGIKLNSYSFVGLVLPHGLCVQSRRHRDLHVDGRDVHLACLRRPLILNQQIGILLVMLLISKGAATVSGGSFVVFAATITSTGILLIEGLAVIFGVYRFLSMAVSTCNSIGNSVATVVVA